MSSQSVDAIGYQDDMYDMMKQTCSQCGGWRPDAADNHGPESLCPKCELGPQYEALEQDHRDEIDRWHATHDESDWWVHPK